MSAIRVSVCIPTYNFGRFIGETLDSILPQVTDEVEVLVVDGASTDNTEEVLRERMIRNPCLTYHRLPEKGGIDKDMAKSVELAKGDYVWLFSADDVMTHDAVDKILRKIRNGMDLYLCSFTRCTIDMKPVAKHPILDWASEAEFDFKTLESRASYFSRALTTTAFFSYMSSIIVRRERWAAAGADESFMGSCWGHVARIFRMIPDGLKVVFLPDDYLMNRGENDSFLEGGRVKRIGIAVDGYHRLGEVYFGGKSAEAFHMRRVLKNEYSLKYLLYTKLLACEGGDRKDREKLDSLVDKLYVDRSPADRFRQALYRLSPAFLLRAAADASRWSRSIWR